MKKTYGVPYQGSKNQIVDWVIEHLPSADTFVDVFAGGCAVTHKAIESQKYKHFVVNDINDTPDLFIDSIKGLYTNENRWFSRDEFINAKDSSIYIKVCWSFNNNGRNYLYSRAIEPWRKALWYARVKDDTSLFDDFGIHTDGSSHDINTNSVEYKNKYIKWYLNKTNTHYTEPSKTCRPLTKQELQTYLRDALTTSGLSQSDVNKKLGNQMAGHYFGSSQWSLPSRESYEKMQKFLPLPKPYEELIAKPSPDLSSITLADLTKLDSLSRLKRLNSLTELNSFINPLDIERKKEDYASISVPDATFYYCDPPYKGTAGYNQTDFDYDRFETWLNTVDKPCIVSEYTCPQGCVEIARTERRQGMQRGGSGKLVTERLFIQKKYLDWYKKIMHQNN